nr:MAG: NEDD4 family-interacting protein 1-like [Chiromantes dehaani nimavirus]
MCTRYIVDSDVTSPRCLPEEDHLGSMATTTVCDQGEDSTTTTAGSLENTLPDTLPPSGRPLSLPSLPDSPPSYEEVQRLKALEATEDYPLPLYQSLGSGASGAAGGLNPETAEIELGTDFIFCITFAVAFVFNFVGYCLLLCSCYSHTVAGHTGAQAGFGFSLAMWTVIVTNRTKVPDWLLCVIMALCVLICMKAILHYIYVKRKWHQVSHNTRHRLFYEVALLAT